MKRVTLLALLFAGCAFEAADLEEGSGALGPIDGRQVLNLSWNLLFPPLAGARTASGELEVSRPFSMPLDVAGARYHKVDVVGGDRSLMRIRLTTFGTFTPAVALEYEARAPMRTWVNLGEYERWPSQKVFAWARVDREIVTVDPDQGIYELTLVRDFRAPLSLYITTAEIERTPGSAVPPGAHYEVQLLNFEEAQSLCGSLSVADIDRKSITGDLEGSPTNLFDGNPASGVTMGLGAWDAAYVDLDASTCQHPNDSAELFLLSASLRSAPESLPPRRFEYRVRAPSLDDITVSIADYRSEPEPEGTVRASIAINEPLRRLKWGYWRSEPSVWDHVGLGEGVDMRDLDLRGIPLLALVRYHALDLRWAPALTTDDARRPQMF